MLVVYPNFFQNLILTEYALQASEGRAWQPLVVHNDIYINAGH
jgi:hypothetical protein